MDSSLLERVTDHHVDAGLHILSHFSELSFGLILEHNDPFDYRTEKAMALYQAALAWYETETSIEAFWALLEEDEAQRPDNWEARLANLLGDVYAAKTFCRRGGSYDEHKLEAFVKRAMFWAKEQDLQFNDDVWGTLVEFAARHLESKYGVVEGRGQGYFDRMKPLFPESRFTSIENECPS